MLSEQLDKIFEGIVDTIREPLIALDQDLRVVTVSRSFYEFFNVTPEETIGKLIYNLGDKQWDIPKLRKLLEKILPEKTSFDNYEVEHDFITIGKRTMLLNARQIKQAMGRELIILLVIEDITERKNIEAGLEKTRKDLAIIKESADEAHEFAINLIDTVREPLITLDQDLRVVTVSRSFYEFFKVKPEETLGQLIYNLGDKQWDIPKLRELLEKILSEKTTFDNYEVEHDFVSIGKRTMLLNARQIKRAMGKELIILLVTEDITERKNIEARLEKTRKDLAIIKASADEAQKFSDNLIDTLREPLITLDQDLRVVTVSRSFYEFFKVKPEETLGQLIYNLGDKQWDIPKLRELLEKILPEKTTFDNYEVEHDFVSIGKRTMLLNARQIKRAMGKELIILLVIEDITERRILEAGLEKTRKDLAIIKESTQAREFADNLIDAVREPLITLDQELRVVTASLSFYDVFKVKPEETIGKSLYTLGNHQWDMPQLREMLENILLKETAFEDFEVEHDFVTIGKRTMLLNARQIAKGMGKEPIILLAIEDITTRKEHDQEIMRLAFHDSLTGVPNRSLLSELLVNILANAKRDKKKVGVAMLDLDNFKAVNDASGHDIGDLLLKFAVERFRNMLRDTDVIARLGGDEFVIVFPDLDIKQDALLILQKIVDGFNNPFFIERHRLVITTSIGMAIYPDDGIDEKILLKKADIAMYQSKKKGGAQYQLYKKI
jgi:diguanylate cyclase (GGDEF)-like protein/PAS domain S-box-containing protein